MIAQMWLYEDIMTYSKECIKWAILHVLCDNHDGITWKHIWMPG